MSDGSGEWFDLVSVSNDGGASFATVRPNGAWTDRVVHKNADSGGRDSPMDLVSPNEAQIGPLGRGRLAGQVYK